MATLTGSTIASTYKQLLKVTSEGIGADASAKYIEDGLGTDSALSISTTRVGIGTAAPTAAKLEIHGGAWNTSLLIKGSGANTGIKFVDSAGNIDGYVYSASSIIGFLDAGGDYMVQCANDDSIKFSITASDKMVLDANSRISLSNNDGNTSNTVFGYNAFTNAGTVLGNVGADYNTAIGDLAMGTGTTTDAAYNVAVGYKALEDITDGDFNVGVGNGAGLNLQTGSSNTIIGSAAGQSTVDVDNAVIIGRLAAGAAMDSDADGTVAIGASALAALTSGGSNTAVGYQSMDATTTGGGNTALGYQSLSGDTDGNGADNTALGHKTLLTATSPSKNVAIGDSAMRYMDASADSIANCVAIGANAFAGTTDTTTGTNGTIAVGYNALTSLTTGAGNTAVGYTAMNDLVDGARNTAIGYNAFGGTFVDTTADSSTDNTFIGHNAGSGNWTTATSLYNVGIGSGVMRGAMYGASENIGIGYEALAALTTGDGNTVMGFQSGDAVTTQSNLTLLGHRTGGAINDNAADGTVAVGASALIALTTGAGNTAVGYQAGNILTTGSANTLLGYEADADAVTDSGHVRLGHYGGVKFMTIRYTLDNSYDSTAAGDAAHNNAILIIPAYSYIRAIYATVVTLSANASAEFTIEYDTTLNVATGAAVGGTEILGAGASTSHWHCTSQAAQDPSSPPDIIASSGGVLKMTYVSLNKDAASSEGWIDSADVGIYIVHSKTNTEPDGGTDAIIQLTVEYTGVS